MQTLQPMAPGKRPLSGVNLGGWLVLEPWMTPSLFAGSGAVDEYTFCSDMTPTRRRALKQFRDTFITEDDFIWLAANGIEAVRVPVGYWLFGKQGPYEKTYQYVDMVFKWASKHGLQVLLDFHGAPGSQNGQMHSGRRGRLSWPKTTNIDLTVTILERIAKRYGQQPSLLGISMLNEPWPIIPRQTLELFYERAQRVMQTHCKPDVIFVFSDAFKPRRWRGRLQGMHVDHHHYQIFLPIDKLLPARLQLWRARYALPRKLRHMARQHPLIIGEWSLVLADRRADSVSYGRAQLKAFESADAWFYWNYKTEGGGLWSFRDCLERGLLKLE